MARSRQRAEWGRACLLATLLEGCRQNDAAIDPGKWLPDDLKETQFTRATKEEVKGFSQFLAMGHGARRKSG